MPDEKQNDEETPEADESQDDANTVKDSLPERATFAVSLLLVLTLFGFLGWQVFHSARPGSLDAAPNVTASLSLKSARRLDESHWVVPVTVKNTGNVALEEVQVRVSVSAKDGKLTDTDLTFNYLAEGATEEAFVVMDAAPETAKPEANVSAFKTQRKARGY